MGGMNRRQFFCAAGLPALLRARGHDVVIRNGRVVDPAQKIDRVMDVALTGGRISGLGKGLQGEQMVDAEGKIVAPGLIDIHMHERDVEMPPAMIAATGVTTLVDGGSRGADNLEDLIGFAKAGPNRMRLLLNIGRLGNNPKGRGEFLDGMEPADVGKARAAIEKNRGWIVGMKARLSRGVAADQDLEVLRRALEVATPLQIPVMIHIGDTASPLPEILALLRPGDIVTHLYAPTAHGIFDDKGKILTEVWAARRRGVRFDFGNGRTEHWSWESAERGLAQGFPPDTISSDLDLLGHTQQVFDLPTVMSKFLLMGMPLMEVIARATVKSAQTFREFHGLGTLKVGAPGDVTVMELAQGSFEFVDNYKNKKTGNQKLVAKTVFAGGKRLV